MSLIDKKVQLYGELSKIDPFEFWDTTIIEEKFSKELKRLKKRHWLFIVYPESAPDNWMAQLEMAGVQFAVSPLHDKDLLANGEPKKPHWHVIVTFEGPTTFLTAASFIEITKGPYPKACENLRGAYEYFIHKNNPEKTQYSSDDVKTFNGFTIEISKKDMKRIKQELVEIIIKNDLSEFMELVIYCEYCLDSEYSDVVQSHSSFFQYLISSYRHNPEKILKRYKWCRQFVQENENKTKEDNKNDS